MQSVEVCGRRVWLLDSVTEGGEAQRDAVVVTASHGGVSAARYALAYRPALVAFNDAGVGKDAAGIAGLALLEEAGVAAVAVSADSARIGEADDTWRSGVIAHVNAPAARLGFRPGQRLSGAVESWLCGGDPAR